MAYTVEGAFTQFYDAINLDGDKRETANARREHLQELLGGSFQILESFASGSIPRFTALRDSDVDIIVALHYGKHIENKTPTQVLQAVRDALGQYKTNVRKNGQAVTLYYQTWPNVDIVPVSRSVNDNGEVTHYNVPDANTESWIKSRPKTHSQNIESRSSTCGYNFRRIIKMLKWWNLQHSNYLQSYHIEVLALNALTANLDDTPWHVYQFFKEARPFAASPLWHDVGYADDYLDANSRSEVLKRFDTAIEKSRDAWYCTYGTNTDHKTAISLWRQVFGDKFPSYG